MAKSLQVGIIRRNGIPSFSDTLPGIQRCSLPKRMGLSKACGMAYKFRLQGRIQDFRNGGAGSVKVLKRGAFARTGTTFFEVFGTPPKKGGGGGS